MKIINKIVSVLVILNLLFMVHTTTALGQQLEEPDYQCVGSSLAVYMNAIIDGAGNLSNIRLLSPAFNMTSFTFQPIVNAMAANNANFAELDGIAGNAYNFNGRLITQYVSDAMSNPALQGKPVLVTETGPIDPSRPALKSELAKIQSGNYGGVNYIGALLFNAFGNNSEFSYLTLTDAEISEACDGNCGNIGVNSATFVAQPDSFYSRAEGLGMGFVLEISNTDTQSTMTAINRAFAHGLTPVIRIGVGSSSGFENPQTYINFLSSINSQIDQPIYAIAGPNEPDSEGWAAPDCQIPEEPIEMLPTRKPIDEGFYWNPEEFSCTETVNPEFHPLRPYPANACDPLIPKSIPEAELTSNFKYNALACGNNIIPSPMEAFDPYGDNGFYEGITVQTSNGNYAHTVCDDHDVTAGGKVTCYRTEGFLIDVDLKDANIGVLGNTQNPNLTEAQLVNNYLSSYFMGTPQISDQKLIDPDSPEDLDRLVNFSGPLRKLLPWDAQNVYARSYVAQAENGQDIHNYLITSDHRIHETRDKLPPDSRHYDNVFDFIRRLNNWYGGQIAQIGPVGIRNPFATNPIWARIFQNVPLTGLEDIAGEYILTTFPGGHHIGGAQDDDVVDPAALGIDTAPIQLNIIEAEPARPGN